MAWYDITGTVSDWIMAGAAAYAAFNAKQWFSQRSHTIGFDKAEEILDAIDKHTQSTKMCIEKIQSIYSNFEEAIQSGSLPSDTNSSEYKESELQHKNYIIEMESLIQQLIRLERWAIHVTNPRIILDVTDSLVSIHTSAINVYQNANACLYDLRNVSRKEFEKTFINLKANYDNFRISIAKLNASYDYFKLQRFDYFFKLQ